MASQTDTFPAWVRVTSYQILVLKTSLREQRVGASGRVGPMDRPRVLVVGAGLTGSLLWRLLRPLAGANPPRVDVQIWDKARKPGGRATTSSVGHAGQADLGMQYISTAATSQLPDVYTELLEARVIADMTAAVAGRNAKYTDPSLRHFAVVNGTSSLCAHFLRGADVALGREVVRVDRSPAVGAEPARWRVTAADGTTESFDGVVLTPPAPQVLGIAGDVGAALADAGVALGGVSFSSRWALALSLPPEAWPAAVALGWGCRYVDKSESPSVCYVAVDQLKRGQAADAAAAEGQGGPTVVLHSGVPWSLANGAATPKADEPGDLHSTVQATLVAEGARLLPELVGAHAAAAEARLHKWRFSQVHRGLEDGDGAVLAADSPLLVVAGDGCTGCSGFDSCVQAADAAAAHLVARL